MRAVLASQTLTVRCVPLPATHFLSLRVVAVSRSIAAFLVGVVGLFDGRWPCGLDTARHVWRPRDLHERAKLRRTDLIAEPEPEVCADRQLLRRVCDRAHPRLDGARP